MAALSDVYKLMYLLEVVACYLSCAAKALPVVSCHVDFSIKRGGGIRR